MCLICQAPECLTKKGLPKGSPFLVRKSEIYVDRGNFMRNLAAIR